MVENWFIANSPYTRMHTCTHTMHTIKSIPLIWHTIVVLWKPTINMIIMQTKESTEALLSLLQRAGLLLLVLLISPILSSPLSCQWIILSHADCLSLWWLMSIAYNQNNSCFHSSMCVDASLTLKERQKCWNHSKSPLIGIIVKSCNNNCKFRFCKNLFSHL